MSTDTRHPNEELPRRRARWGFAFYGSGLVLLVAAFFYGVPSLPDLAPGLGNAAAVLAVGVPSTLLLVGLAQLGRASIGAVRPAKAATVLLALATLTGAAAVVGAFNPNLSWFLLFSTLLPLLVLSSGVCAIFGWASYAATTRGYVPPVVHPRGRMISLMALGMLALIAVGTVELLVWMPQTLAPGYSVDEIYTAVGQPDISFGIARVVIWAGFWTLAILAWAIVLGLVARRRGVSARTIVASGALLAGALLFFQSWAGFGLGMNVSDTLPPGVGGMSSAGLALAALGFACSIAGIFGLLAPRHPRSAPVTAGS